MGKIKGRTLLSGALVREYLFDDQKTMDNFLKKTRGEYYLLHLEEVFGHYRAIIATQYNGAPLWKENRR